MVYSLYNSPNGVPLKVKSEFDFYLAHLTVRKPVSFYLAIIYQFSFLVTNGA